jgi:tRNA splicing endonuclease
MTKPQSRDHQFGNPVCIEKQRLQDMFIAACHELNTLQSDQISAVITGDSDFMRFDDLLHLAREKKEQAKYALLSHMEEHRC